MTSGDDKFNIKDDLLVYDFEGQDSPVGSIGCCSLLESKDDLHFLDDLGPKFKTLAEVCGGTKIQTEIKQVVSPLPNVSATKIQTSESHLVATPPMSLPPKLSSPEKTDHIVKSETTKQSVTMKESMTAVKEEMSSVKQGMGNPNQMLLVQQQQQQPVYYTTAPMMQPMHYVVQPAFQNTMVLTEAPATNLQNMVLVTNTDTGSSHGVLVQGQTVMSTPQAQGLSTVLNSSGIYGSYTNLIHSGTLSGSQTMLVVDSKVPAGSMKIINGSQAGLIQGGAVTRELSRSQSYLIVGEPTNGRRQQGQEVKGVLPKNEVSASQKILNRKRNKSTGSHNSVSSTAIKTTSNIRNSVVQSTKEVH